MTVRREKSEAETKIEECAAELGLTIRADFVPFSQSSGYPDWLSLNWRVTLEREGRDVLTTDYAAGCGHCPAPKGQLRRQECETGLAADGGAPINPKLADVLYSLANDASAIDAGCFEDWCAEFGYDTDSRKAEATYRACLETALKLRNALGEDGLSRLREACADY